MANNRYARGATLERTVAADWRKQGYVTARCAGSHGAFDVIAVKHGDLILAQCKSGGKYPFAGFGPASRERLAAEAALAGGRAVLVFKGTRQRGYDVIGMEEWPNGR